MPSPSTPRARTPRRDLPTAGNRSFSPDAKPSSRSASAPDRSRGRDDPHSSHRVAHAQANGNSPDGVTTKLSPLIGDYWIRSSNVLFVNDDDDGPRSRLARVRRGGWNSVRECEVSRPGSARTPRCADARVPRAHPKRGPVVNQRTRDSREYEVAAREAERRRRRVRARVFEYRRIIIEYIEMKDDACAEKSCIFSCVCESDALARER